MRRPSFVSSPRSFRPPSAYSCSKHHKQRHAATAAFNRYADSSQHRRQQQLRASMSVHGGEPQLLESGTFNHAILPDRTLLTRAS
jgi:hypothetical protein